MRWKVKYLEDPKKDPTFKHGNRGNEIISRITQENSPELTRVENSLNWNRDTRKIKAKEEKKLEMEHLANNIEKLE